MPANFRQGDWVEWAQGDKRCRATWPTIVRTVQHGWGWTDNGPSDRKSDGVWGPKTQRKFSETLARVAGFTVDPAGRSVSEIMAQLAIAAAIGKADQWHTIALGAGVVLPQFEQNLTDRHRNQFQCFTGGAWHPTQGTGVPTVRTPETATGSGSSSGARSGSASGSASGSWLADNWGWIVGALVLVGAGGAGYAYREDLGPLLDRYTKGQGTGAARRSSLPAAASVPVAPVVRAPSVSRRPLAPAGAGRGEHATAIGRIGGLL